MVPAIIIIISLIVVASSLRIASVQTNTRVSEANEVHMPLQPGDEPSEDDECSSNLAARAKRNGR